MKKVALTVAVLALGLAACETKTENAVENVAVENAVEADVNAATENVAVDEALDANAAEAPAADANAEAPAADNAM